MAPWADVLYACDGEWWKVHIEEARRSFPGELWTQDIDAASRHRLFRVSGESRPGLGKNALVHFGENSGYQAINIAYLFGAAKIVLLGFDMQMTGGQSHWHGDHPPSLNRNSPLKQFAKNFKALSVDLAEEGVEVINATRETALDCFPKMNLEDVL